MSVYVYRTLGGRGMGNLCCSICRICRIPDRTSRALESMRVQWTKYMGVGSQEVSIGIHTGVPLSSSHFFASLSALGTRLV